MASQQVLQALRRATGAIHRRWPAWAGALSLAIGAAFAAFLVLRPVSGPEVDVWVDLESDTFYFGVNLQWGQDSPAAFAQRTGIRPNVLGTFFRFPIPDGYLPALEDFVSEARRQGAIAFMTLEPLGGLDLVTQETAAELADYLRTVNERGVPVMLRFAHEMNGSWYPWGQQPQEYVAAFRLVAQEIHGQAPRTAMVWAPNYGGGYPFAGGRFEAKPGTSAFALLDTNGDGELTMEDDPYAPYYPGSDAVDWVGLTLYHWGDAYQWGDNVEPEPSKFIAQVMGSYAGEGGDHTALPNFYEAYAEAGDKPMTIAETAALFVPDEQGDELAVKAGWWKQVFSLGTIEQLPLLRNVNWFEWVKPEPEVMGRLIDWRATHTATLSRSFSEHLRLWLQCREWDAQGSMDLQETCAALGSGAE